MILLLPRSFKVIDFGTSRFYQLRQLRRIRRSLNDNSIATLVHPFVISHVDCCVGLLAGAPKKTTDKLQRVFNVAARVHNIMS